MADVADPTAALNRLVDFVRGVGVDVRLVPRNGRPHDAKYDPPEDGGPRITIWCDRDTAHEIQRRASQLAHEFGHHLSYVAGWRTQAFLAASFRFNNWCNFELTPDEIGLVLHEECVAWRIGHIVIQACGVELPEYALHWMTNLNRYCEHMAVKTDADKKEAVGKADKLALHHLHETAAGAALLDSLGVERALGGPR